MQQVAIHAFDPETAKQLEHSEPIAVKHDGKIVGYYIPTPPSDTAEMREAMERLREAVQQALAESGMTEDELADALLIGDHDWRYYAPRD